MMDDATVKAAISIAGLTALGLAFTVNGRCDTLLLMSVITPIAAIGGFLVGGSRPSTGA